MPRCLIIGGGVVGLTIARRLAREGAQVTVLERGRVGREASWAGAGVLSPPNPHRRDAAAKLQLRSLALYPQFCAELFAETGIDPEYELCGEIELAFDEGGLRALAEDVDAAGGRKIPVELLASFQAGRTEASRQTSSRHETPPVAGEPAIATLEQPSGCSVGELPSFEMLSREQALSMEPGLSPGILGAMLCRETGQVRNPRLLRALHESCKAVGVVVREQTPVSDLVESSGRVTGVRFGQKRQLGPEFRRAETEEFTAEGRIESAEGDVAEGEHVILCAGAWSSQIAARLDAVMPVRPVRGQMILMAFGQRPLRHIVARGKTYLVPRRDGHVLLGATEERQAGYNKRCTPQGIADLVVKGMKLVPAVAEAPVAAAWAGLRPGAPDDLPYIGQVPGFDGLLAATGHFRTGLSLAPATAEVIAALVFGREYDLDLSCCRPGRGAGT